MAHHPGISSTSKSSSGGLARSESEPARPANQHAHMQGKQDPRAAGSPCVEFVYRVYADGRRERFATVLFPTTDGKLVAGTRRPSGRVGSFVAKAVSEWRRIGIDPRGEESAGYGRRR